MTKKKNIVVELREDMKVYVTGPLHEKDLCLAMLDEAVKAVKNWKQPLVSVPKQETINKILNEN